MNNITHPAYRITDLHENERPRERLSSLGPQALSNAELIAILLRVGVQGENAVQVGQRLLQKFGGLGGLHARRLMSWSINMGSVKPKPRRSKPRLN